VALNSIPVDAGYANPNLRDALNSPTYILLYLRLVHKELWIIIYTNLSEKISAFTFRVALHRDELIPLIPWYQPEVSNRKITVFETSKYIPLIT